MREEARSMKVFKRTLAVVVLLLGAAGLLLSVGVGIGIWIVKGPATAKATHVFERLETALDIADQGLNQVKTSLGRASERLDSAREEQQKLAREPQRNSTLQRMLARTVQQSIAPELGEANKKLHTVAEAAVVVNSVLEDVGNFPFLSVAGLDFDRLSEMNDRLANVAPAAWELSRLLGEPEADSHAASNQLSRIERTLTTLRERIAEFEPELMQVRQRTEGLKSRTLPWITAAAVLISAVCFWIALSQVSVACHAWSWWKHSGHNNSPTIPT
jgi:predicted translin family RNA/ssDNA-binding protein